MLSGIMPETPLGRIVGIRAEKDPKVIKEFTKEQKKIRNDWILRRNRKLMEDHANYNKYWSDFQNWAKTAVSYTHLLTATSREIGGIFIPNFKKERI